MMMFFNNDNTQITISTILMVPIVVFCRHWDLIRIGYVPIVFKLLDYSHLGQVLQERHEKMLILDKTPKWSNCKRITWVVATISFSSLRLDSLTSFFLWGFFSFRFFSRGTSLEDRGGGEDLFPQSNVTKSEEKYGKITMLASLFILFCLSILTRWVLTNWITEKLVLQLATAQCVKIVQNKSHFQSLWYEDYISNRWQ